MGDDQERPTQPRHLGADAAAPVVAVLPTQRPTGRPLDPPEKLTVLCREAPLARLRYPDGHVGWLATGYEQVRTVLAERRFSSRYELIHLPFPGVTGGVGVPADAPGPAR